ncbi:MAG: ATP-binding protein, partial [Omnitrophica WOR_2 bacterium]
VTIHCGYNLIREKTIDRFDITSPSLAGELRAGLPWTVVVNDLGADLGELAQVLNVTQLGYLMGAPFQPGDASEIYSLLLLTPYTDRIWQSEDEQYLSNFTELLERILHQTDLSHPYEQELAQARELLQTARLQQENMQRDNQSLLSQLDEARQEARQEQERAESLVALLASQDASQVGEPPYADKPAESVGTFSEGDSSTQEKRHLEEELRRAQADLAQFQGLLSESERKLQELNQPSGAAGMNSDQAEIIASISQELRQPMSSIVGYTDLLLGESTGILGALQRKFLERVKASTVRMSSLVDDLIQVGTTGNGGFKLSPQHIDLSAIIDEAIAATIAPMREKNIILRVDIPENLPVVTADRDAMSQILLHLLQNAASATPIEGEIALRASVQEEDQKADYILLQVSDSGEGIPPEDLPRVFTRLYRADNPLIQGIGDTGVGLSIVKTLVEAHGGRIWVDSVLGKGSSFSVLLPILSKASVDSTQDTAGGGSAP